MMLQMNTTNATQCMWSMLTLSVLNPQKFPEGNKIQVFGIWASPQYTVLFTYSSGAIGAWYYKLVSEYVGDIICVLKR